MRPPRTGWKSIVGALDLPPVLEIDLEGKSTSSSESDLPARILPAHIEVTEKNLNGLCQLLPLNHDRSYSEVYHTVGKDEAIYGFCTFVIDGLDLALKFFANMPQRILSKLRNIILWVERGDILEENDKLLHALQLIADCPPARKLQNTGLSFSQTFPVHPGTKQGEPKQGKPKQRKHKSRQPVFVPRFIIWGLLGLRLQVTVRAKTKKERVKMADMERLLDRVPRGSRVNFLNRLPNELLDMIYHNLIPSPETTTERGSMQPILDTMPLELVKYRRFYASTWTINPADWNTYHNPLEVCRKMKRGMLQVLSNPEEPQRKRKWSWSGFDDDYGLCLHRSKRLAVSLSTDITQ